MLYMALFVLKLDHTASFLSHSEKAYAGQVLRFSSLIKINMYAKMCVKQLM